jgi:subtilisin family serine protease
MTVTVAFLTIEERNSFAQKVGMQIEDSLNIVVGNNLLTYSMRYQGAEVMYTGSSIKLLVSAERLASLEVEHTVASQVGNYCIIETQDPVEVYAACDGDVDLVESQIKLLSQLTGPSVANPNDWARRRLSNRFRPFQEFKTFDITTTNKPVVFVVDSGINAHSELSGVEIVNFGKTPFCNTFADNLGHGTAVSTCIAGKNVGITQNVSLYNYKIFDGQTKPTILELADVLDDIKEFKQSNPSKNVTVNASWSTPYSPFLNNKFAELINAGCVIVCAAGNSGDDVSNYTPAGMSSVITVGAIDADDIVAGFTATSTADASVTSPYGQSLDIFAPGVDVDVAAQNTGYVTVSGTSFSAGYVSAAVALIQSISTQRPSNAEIVNLLSATSLKGAILFNRETFTNNQNKIVQLINGDSIPSTQFYLGTFSGSVPEINLQISSFLFNHVSTIASDTVTYEINWQDAGQKTTYEQFVSFDQQTGAIVITRPTTELPAGVEYEKVGLTFTKTTNYSTETSSPVFFYVTNSEEVPDVVTAELSDTQHINASSNLTLSAKP